MTNQKKLTLALFATLAISTGAINSAMAQNSGNIEIRQILSRIETKFKDFKDRVEDYYGISVNGYDKPSNATILEYTATKKNRNNLASLFSNRTNQNVVRAFSSRGQVIGMAYAPDSNHSLTQEDLVGFMTIPYSKLDCADCPVTVDGIYDRNNRGLTFPYTAVSTSEILSAGSVGSGYKNPAQAAPLSANALLGPLQYAESAVSITDTYEPNTYTGYESQETSSLPRKIIGKNALQFIEHLISIKRFRIYPKLPPKSETQDGMKTRNQYLANLYSFASRVSVGLSNINQMYAARVPNASGKSKLRAENDMVMRHLKSDWQDSIKNGNPAMVQKEIAFLLAEMNYQLFQNRLLTERLLLTQSVKQITQARPPNYNTPLGQ